MILMCALINCKLCELRLGKYVIKWARPVFKYSNGVNIMSINSSLNKRRLSYNV